ncbi:hypothetical protein F8388_019190 [Cannabis sativa]|uniref:Protein kinase domain-containing protein n=1 Tax=Cannabis sativa TaxID=3483 RepID=A0A7J6F5P0_CANSA|nr:hypothetical protein F8388_019190 [Cannabis sativa]
MLQLLPFKADMYNFGVLLFEVLTGRAPSQYPSLASTWPNRVEDEEQILDLPKWVRSVVKEEWTGIKWFVLIEESCKMDRNWMSANRLSAEYKEGLFIMEPAPNDDDEWAQYEESFMPEEHNNEVEEPNIEVEEPNIEVEEPPPKQKNTRGRTKRLDITRLASEGKKLEIEYNNLGQQWGKAATDLVSRIGVWVRINIPLVNKKWPQIDKELKNRLWNDVKDVAPQLLEKPPRLYEDIIDETEWTEFVASRLTKEWGVTRKNAQASRAKNIYPHRSGRGGARMVELQMEKELGHQLVKIDRADLWKRLRTNSKGELEGPAVEVAQRIIEYEKFWKERTH